MTILNQVAETLTSAKKTSKNFKIKGGHNNVNEYQQREVF